MRGVHSAGKHPENAHACTHAHITFAQGVKVDMSANGNILFGIFFPGFSLLLVMTVHFVSLLGMGTVGLQHSLARHAVAMGYHHCICGRKEGEGTKSG